MKPVIGITTFRKDEAQDMFCGVNDHYIRSVILAGGIPVLIPIVNDKQAILPYIEVIDGLVLSGGGDVAPLIYGEEPIKQTAAISWERDEQEMALCSSAYEKKIPILGICRGIQIINLTFGGTLYQDIEKQVPNALGHYPLRTTMDQLHHSVKLLKGSRLYDLFMEEEIYVNSFHHQAVKKVGKGLKPTAFSSEGVIEALESENECFVVGLQWHPEALTIRYPKFLSLFTDLVEASIQQKKNR